MTETFWFNSKHVCIRQAYCKDFQHDNQMRVNYRSSKLKVVHFYIYEPIVLNSDNKFIIDLRRQAFSCDRQDFRLGLVDWEFIWVGPVMYFICRKKLVKVSRCCKGWYNQHRGLLVNWHAMVDRWCIVWRIVGLKYCLEELCVSLVPHLTPFHPGGLLAYF